MKKFFGVIGNPPYQEETEGNKREKPIYDSFMDSAYQVGEVVELITPARFLFNAGQTSKAWNRKMLGDSHLKIAYYEPDSEKVFPPPTDIKGGVAVTIRNEKKDYGAIGIFTPYPELNSIIEKVTTDEANGTLTEIITGGVPYSYTEELRTEYPQSVELTGNSYDVRTNALDKLTGIIYFDTPQDDDEDWVQILGLYKGKRTYKWIHERYLNKPENFSKYKVFIPKSNGAGKLGEVLSTPLVAAPKVGHTQTFISIGRFDEKNEAEACLKYVKSKFARTLLGVLKTTQDNPKNTWKYIPLQDFTSNSDIDWSKSVAEIDQQLYKKYGFTENEIEFIETHIKEMN